MTDNNTSGFSTADRKAQDEAGIAILDALVKEKHGGRMLKLDQLIADRDDGGKVILKPKAQKLEETQMIIAREIEANAQSVQNTRTFKARPYDGAIAFQTILYKVFGQPAIGAQGWGPPPEVKQVQTGVTRDENGNVVPEVTKVTWGVMEFAPLEAKFILHEAYDDEYGHCFGVNFLCAKKWEDHVEALFNEVESYLLANSIYKGKAIKGVGANGETNPKIIDPYNVDRAKVVMTAQVESALDNSVFGVMRQAKALRAHGINLGEKILLSGTNGSGKSLNGRIGMQIAIENGWTAIQAESDEDLHQVVAFAERLAPAYVFIEDVEKVMDPAFSGSSQKMEKLLDLFDGAGSKGREVMLVMTTNHDHELSKSMLRPGRIDRIIPVGAMDADSMERLVKVTAGENRVEGVDFEALAEIFDGCTPVWMCQLIARAERAVIIRTGSPKESFATEDFLNEAYDLIEQLKAHRAASDRRPVPEIESAFKSLVRDEVRTAVSPLLNNWGLQFSEA